jgi:glutamate dehydrogenase
VRAAVEDWQPMRAGLLDAAARSRSRPPPVAPDELAEDLAFLRWLADDNFTCSASATTSSSWSTGQDVLRVVPGSGLGILRGGTGAAAASASFAALPPEVRARRASTRWC